MLRVITIRNYEILKMQDKKEYDHATIVKIHRVTEEEKNTPIPDKIVIPKISSIGDYTAYQKKYNIVIFIDDEISYSDDDTPMATVLGFPVPKEIGEVEENTVEASDVKQNLDGSTIHEEYKIVRSEDGSAYVAVSNNSVVLKAGNNRFVIGKDNIARMGDVVDYNLPSNNHAIVKESGMLRLLPKCFIPPFALPDYLPNSDLIVQASRLSKIIKDMEA